MRLLGSDKSGGDENDEEREQETRQDGGIGGAKVPLTEQQ